MKYLVDNGLYFEDFPPDLVGKEWAHLRVSKRPFGPPRRWKVIHPDKIVQYRKTMNLDDRAYLNIKEGVGYTPENRAVYIKNRGVYSHQVFTSMNVFDGWIQTNHFRDESWPLPHLWLPLDIYGVRCFEEVTEDYEPLNLHVGAKVKLLNGPNCPTVGDIVEIRKTKQGRSYKVKFGPDKMEYLIVNEADLQRFHNIWHRWGRPKSKQRTSNPKSKL